MNIRVSLRRYMCTTLLLLPVVAATQESHKIDSLISLMTLDEKIHLIGPGVCANNGEILRLGIKAMKMSDGPHGLTYGPTALVDGIGLGATWDIDLASSFGMVLGRECRAKNVDVLLGPAINIHRSPLDARINEYYSEDPMLTGEIIVPVVKAIQSNEVVAQVKHYVCFNQETNRRRVNVLVDEQALREIYLPHWFRVVREANPLAIMASYNWIRGEQAAQNAYALQTVLKGEMGFEGFVMTDWQSEITAYESAMNGLDLEVCTEFWKNELKALIEGGRVPVDTVNEKVRRILRAMYRAKLLAWQSRSPAPSLTQVRDQHKSVNRTITAASIVLLKNEGILPLSIDASETLAIIGENGAATHAEDGKCNRVASYEVTPLMGLVSALTDNGTTITYSRGYSDGETIPTNPLHNQYVSAGDYADSGTEAEKRAAAMEAARAADHVVIFGGSNRTYNSCSYHDRTDIDLHGGQNELIDSIVSINANTVVVLVGGGPLTMPWLARVKAVVQLFPGSGEIGNAIADVLLGVVNPSGRLPITFPKRVEDIPASATAAAAGGTWTDGVYREGIFVGYRWYDKEQIEPLFPFGHGLSYNEYSYSNLGLVAQRVGNVATCRVTFDVTNEGQIPGAEVAQVYVQDVAASVPRPVKELKGFSKVMFGEGGTRRTVSIELDSGAFAFYDESSKGWKVEPGEFKVMVGASSRDIRLQGSVSWPFSATGIKSACPAELHETMPLGREQTTTTMLRVLDVSGRTVHFAEARRGGLQSALDRLLGSARLSHGVYVLHTFGAPHQGVASRILTLPAKVR